MQQKIEYYGGRIDKIYYCPHLESDNCLCRKPKPGMIKNAIIDFPEIKIDHSYLVGDSDSDIIAGKKFGLNTVKVDEKFKLIDWAKKFNK